MGRDFLPSLRIFRYIMGAKFDMDKLLSPALVGRVRCLEASNPVRKQTRPLTVAKMASLEELAANGADPMDRYYAGCLLFVSVRHCPARPSRLGRWIHGKLYGFVEGSTRVQKTATSAEKKAISLSGSANPRRHHRMLGDCAAGCHEGDPAPRGQDTAGPLRKPPLHPGLGRGRWLAECVPEHPARWR